MKAPASWLSLPLLLACTQLELAFWLGLLGALIPLLSGYSLTPLHSLLTGYYRHVGQLLVAALLLTLSYLLFERYDLPLAQQLAPWLGLTLLPCLALPAHHQRLSLQLSIRFFALALTLGGLNSGLGLLQDPDLIWYQATASLAQPSLNLLLLGALLALLSSFSKDYSDER